MALAAARRLMLQFKSVPASRRSMADYHIPKADTSMDHVFSDNSVKLPFNFQPPSMMKTFAMTCVAMAVFGGPVWIMLSDDWKMQAFLAKLEEAKATKAGKAGQQS